MDAKEVHYEQVQSQTHEEEPEPEEQQPPLPPPAQAAEEADDMIGVLYPRNFSVDQMIKLEQGVTDLPGMEHKWLIEYRGRDVQGGPYVRFVRSWSGELIFVIPVDERRNSGVLFVKRSLYEERSEEETIHLFDIVLNVVVFKERFPHYFNINEPASLQWWSWIGIYVTNQHVIDTD